MCVIWPFKLDPTTGWIVAGVVAGIILIQYIVGLIKRLIEPSTAEPA